MQDKSANSDLTIIPFGIAFDFLAKWKRGIGSRHGPTQDLKSEYLNIAVEMQECQGIKIAREEIEEEDEEDFDDDEFDDEPEAQDKPAGIK